MISAEQARQEANLSKTEKEIKVIDSCIRNAILMGKSEILICIGNALENAKDVFHVGYAYTTSPQFSASISEETKNILLENGYKISKADNRTLRVSW